MQEQTTGRPAESPEIMPTPPVRWLTRGVGGIGLASFLSDLGHEVPTSLLPSLLTSTLGAPAAALGAVEGIADGLAGLARLAGGALADDPAERRKTAIGGYTSLAVLSSLIGVSTAVWQVGLFRVGSWISRGIRVPARNALLADLVPASVYGRAYGFERAMDNLGAIGGPLLALGLVSIFSVRTAILISVIPGLLATLAIFYAIKHIPVPTVRERQPLRLRMRPVMQGKLGRLMIGVATFELGNAAATLLILRATQLLSPNHSQQAATQLALGCYIAYNVAATITSFPAGRLNDKRSPLLVLTIGVLFFLIAYLGFAVGFTTVIPLALAFIAGGVAIGCIETAEHAAVATLAPSDVRGSAFGLLAGVQSFGNIIASGVAGLLWTALSGGVAFLYLAAWMVISLAVLVWLMLTAQRT